VHHEAIPPICYTRGEMSDVVVIGGPPPVSFEEIRRRLTSYLTGTAVMRAVVFGSFARGTADMASDLDLVLVEETSLPFVERGRTHAPLFGLGVGIDLLVYTPAEYERMIREGNPLIERVEEEGVVIHARPRE